MSLNGKGHIKYFMLIIIERFASKVEQFRTQRTSVNYDLITLTEGKSSVMEASAISNMHFDIAKITLVVQHAR